MISKFFALAILFAVCCIGQISSADVVENASFESGSAGWTVSGNMNVVNNQGQTDGLSAMAFSWNNQPSNGILSQMLTVEPNTTYDLEFDFGKFSVNQAGVAARLQVDVFDTDFAGTNLLSQIVEDFTPETGVSSADASVFSPFEFSFTSITGTAVLVFTDISDAQISGGGFDAMLDNVRASASVPEPAGCAFLLLGGLACLRRTRR